MLKIKLTKKILLVLFGLLFISCNNKNININQLYAEWDFFNFERNTFPFEQLKLKNKEQIRSVELLKKDYKLIQYFENSRVSKRIENIYASGDPISGEVGGGVFLTEVFYNADGNLSEVKNYMGEIASEYLYSDISYEYKFGKENSIFELDNLGNRKREYVEREIKNGYSLSFDDEEINIIKKGNKIIKKSKISPLNEYYEEIGLKNGIQTKYSEYSVSLKNGNINNLMSIEISDIKNELINEITEYEYRAKDRKIPRKRYIFSKYDEYGNWLEVKVFNDKSELLDVYERKILYN